MSNDTLTTLTITARQGSEDVALAEAVLDGVTTSALRVAQFSSGTYAEISLDETVKRLREQTYEVRSGDLTGLEAMLVGQTATLNSIFLECSRQAWLNLAGKPDEAERYMRMAFRAQSQCRSNIESVRAMKTPSTLIASQLNISNGPQQVNNWTERSRERGEK